MRYTPRTARLTATTVAAALVAAGSVGYVAPASASSDVHLVLTMWGSTIDQTTYQQRANLYTKTHPNVTITVKNIPVAEYDQQVETDIAGGDEPDIIEVSPGGDGNAVGWATDGELVNLAPYLAKINATSIYTPEALLNGLNYKGLQYALPDRGGYVLLYYNKTMFNKAGLAYPKTGWTWAQFVQDAEKLTIVQNGKTVQWGAAVDNWENAVDSVVHSFGGNQLNSSWTKAAVDSPAYQLGLTQYEDLVTKYHVSPTLQDYANYGVNINRDALFAEGKTAMIWAGAWDIPVDVQDHIDFGLATPPVGIAGNANIMGFGTGLAVGAHGTDPQVATDVVLFMTSAAGQVPIVTNHEDVPSSTADLPLYLKGLPAGISASVFDAPKSDIFMPQAPPQYNQIETAWADDLYPFFTGKESVQAATTKTAAAMDAALPSK